MSRSICAFRVLGVAVAAIALACEPARAAGETSGPAAGTEDRIADISVVGTDFRVRLASGRVLTGRDLVGARLKLDVQGGVAPQQVRIDAVVNDPLDPSGETLIYRMRALAPESGQWQELCNPDAAGERWAFPLRGLWDADGYVLSDRGLTLTCGDGAMGK